MTGRRSLIFQPKLSVGLSRNWSKGPPLTQVNGEKIQSNKRQKVGSTSATMKEDLDPLYDPITAPPESSDDEAENIPSQQPTENDSPDSDEDYNRRKAADIRGTTFDDKTPKSRACQAYGGKSRDSKSDEPSGLAGSKRSAGVHESKAANQLERELEAPRDKKKKPSRVTKYGVQSKNKTPSSSQAVSSASRGAPSSSTSQDNKNPISTIDSFHRVKSISPMKSQSPRKTFRTKRHISDFDEPENSQPSFKNPHLYQSSPLSTPRKRRSPVGRIAEDRNGEAANPTTKSSRSVRPVQRKGSKKGKHSPNFMPEETPPRPVFKIPGLEDNDSFDDNGSLDYTTTPIESQDTSWDRLEIEETKTTATPRCPICHQEVDHELLEKYSTHGKMSVKQQTIFCRLHRQQSAAKAGTEKGYPKIDWETLDSRFNSHQDFLQNILEGTQASHYRKVLRERVESGKNRTLLTNHDNFTPGYYGPRGLQVMTQFIMRTLSDVIRRRAVEDKLISARSYTGYVQTVLVPELAVRLIMEDISVTEERARQVLEESVEIGELLHEEVRDVVTMNEIEDDMSLEI
ncbi:RTC4-like domain-containing protein [Xylaria sp. FL1777]|nr:RTC4-like domain-containing protein [Xylaria sp. FL1777]